MSLPSINFLHLTVSEIQPRQTISRRPPTHPPSRPPAHPDTMGENNTPTALKGCGVKTVSNEACSLTTKIEVKSIGASGIIHKHTHYMCSSSDKNISLKTIFIWLFMFALPKHIALVRIREGYFTQLKRNIFYS